MDCSEEDLASLQPAHGRLVLDRHAQHDPVELRLGKSFDLPVPLALARGFLLFFSGTDPDFRPVLYLASYSPRFPREPGFRLRELAFCQQIQDVTAMAPQPTSYSGLRKRQERPSQPIPPQIEPHPKEPRLVTSPRRLENQH